MSDQPFYSEWQHCPDSKAECQLCGSIEDQAWAESPKAEHQLVVAEGAFKGLALISLCKYCFKRFREKDLSPDLSAGAGE